MIIIGLIAVALASRELLNQVLKVARALQLPPGWIAVLVLGVLSSLPEIGITGMSIAEGQHELALSNLLGSSVGLLLFVLPSLVLLNGALRANPQLRPRALLIISALMAFIPLFGLDGQFDRLEGSLMVVFGIVAITFYRPSEKERPIRSGNHVLIHSLLALLYSGIVFLASYFVVHNASLLSQYWKIAPALIGVGLLALGSNLPELMMTLVSWQAGRVGLGLRNYIGSLLINIILIGLVIVIKPFSIPSQLSPALIGWMATSIYFFFLFIKDRRLTRIEAFIMLSSYIGMLLLTLIWPNIPTLTSSSMI